MIKLTKRPAVGEKSLQCVAGTLPYELACPSSDTSEDEASGERGNTRESLSENEAPMDSFWSASDISEPTLHELESRASVAELEKIRKEIMEVVTESAAM